MSYLIKVNQVTQLQIIEDGKIKAKSLLPNTKYIIKDIRNKQIVDLKTTKCLFVKNASVKEESCYENLELV